MFLGFAFSSPRGSPAVYHQIIGKEKSDVPERKAPRDASDGRRARRVEDAARKSERRGGSSTRLVRGGRLRAAIFHVPDRILGHQKYNKQSMSREVLDQIARAIARGETSDDFGNLVSVIPPMRRPRTKQCKRIYSK